MGSSGHFTHFYPYVDPVWILSNIMTGCHVIKTCCTFGRGPRTKETLLDFHEWCQVTRHSRIFCGLTGCQRTPEKWGVTKFILNILNTYNMFLKLLNML